jgi:adenine/guanine phosphoribosyltransferase-like PRPP-binding protein
MSYLPHTYKPSLVKALASIEEATYDIRQEFDYVLVTGLSGIVPGAIFCHQHDKQLVVQRKRGESSHGTTVEGPYDWDDLPTKKEHKEYIIIDDFMASGATLERLLEAHGNGRLPKYVVLYHRNANLRICTQNFMLNATGVPGRYTIVRTKP